MLFLNLFAKTFNIQSPYGAYHSRSAKAAATNIKARVYLAINKGLTAGEAEYKNVVSAWVAELVDARDLKSLGPCARTSSILVLGTKMKTGG